MSIKKPPSIKFYEDESLNVSPFVSTRLTKVVRFCTFGLVKSDAQASLIILILVSIGLVLSLQFINGRKSIPPTTTFELLPQESIGSIQGVPQQPNNETN